MAVCLTRDLPTLLLCLRAVVPRGCQLEPSGYLSDLYELSGGSSSVVQWGDSRDPAPCPTMHRTAPQDEDAADETGY